tara:strand:+ start:399 stop:680 length:282 start_codon:yes stop_codon:yes gene_type:complete
MAKVSLKDPKVRKLANRLLVNPRQYKSDGAIWGKDKKTGRLTYLRVGRRKNELPSTRIFRNEITRLHEYGPDDQITSKRIKGQRVAQILKRKR